ncbi:tRNA pseudouridine(38-40) synthase TruA [Pseudostreptobacillus hongkongensis]|uniref:tRNA pseudouridine(38-40) synthase TruA n=1 Tax=Pseudostreptobacillus hongkongensis TaxID=1162717 RepID=UPI0028D8C7D8|nr:tRNA pseudouridine(38-40) synthase TruA [Pseudostreptobacillus hongkongensis]
MKNIKIVYQYDGSCFYGSQRQKEKKTVQGTIENILKNSFNVEVNMISSGRTDRGVHAKMQVSNFLIKRDIPFDIMKKKIEKHSDYEIKIIDISYVDLEYNSRYDTNIRVYEYILDNRVRINPFETKYISGIEYDIDVEKFNKILKEFEGEHDFSSFSKKDNKANKNPVRCIYECYAIEKNGRVYVYIKGNSFLKTMVRIIIGTTLAIYEGKIDIRYIKENFENPDPDIKKFVADGNGLYLYNIE